MPGGRLRPTKLSTLRPLQPRHVGFWVASVVVLALLSLAAIWPIVSTLVSARGESASLTVDIGLLASSLGIALLIAVLATVVALPGAWVVRRSRGTGLAGLMAPLLLPSYLAYTGWGIIRAPDTAIGRWLMMGPRGIGGPSDAANWYPIAAGHILAIAGLVLWSWPLAALLIGVRFRRIDDSVLDSLTLDVRSVLRRRLEVLWMSRGAIAASIGLVALVMLGSAVPLHLAQLDTYAIRLWRLLDQTPRAEQWRVWVGAWPLMVVAAGGAIVITRRVLSSEVGDGVQNRPARGMAAFLATGVLSGLAILVPVVLLASNIRNWHGATTFLSLIRDPLLNSLVVAIAVGAASTALIVWMWIALTGRQRTLAVGVAAVLLMTGLMPGILIGASTARAWSGVPWIGDSHVAVILCHLARFGMVGVLAGWWLAATEGRWLRDMRQLDAGLSLRGWAESTLFPNAGTIAAGAVAAGFLSFHEIESTVLVQPPSASGGSFSWQMLQWLHFARMDELAMGVLMVVGLGLAAGGVIFVSLRSARA
jgi:ABC-type Fe3+ transport system permease subunit